MNSNVWILTFSDAISIATTLILATLGAILTERSGVINLGVEGILLMGAVTAFLVSDGTGNLWLALFLSVLVGIPLGIIMARINWLRSIMLPILDVMQTMPSFVYLIPVVMLFGLGKIPALIATVIYAVPPLIRLTDLGIRLVDREVLEASRAFGATSRQQLFGVQLPLAMPNIMAGINQTTMMALSSACAVSNGLFSSS